MSKKFKDGDVIVRLNGRKKGFNDKGTIVQFTPGATLQGGNYKIHWDSGISSVKSRRFLEDNYELYTATQPTPLPPSVPVSHPPTTLKPNKFVTGDLIRAAKGLDFHYLSVHVPINTEGVIEKLIPPGSIAGKYDWTYEVSFKNFTNKRFGVDESDLVEDYSASQPSKVPKIHEVSIQSPAAMQVKQKLHDCECGSYAVGFTSRGAGHSDYCPMSKEWP